MVYTAFCFGMLRTALSSFLGRVAPSIRYPALYIGLLLEGYRGTRIKSRKVKVVLIIVSTTAPDALHLPPFRFGCCLLDFPNLH